MLMLSLVGTPKAAEVFRKDTARKEEVLRYAFLSHKSGSLKGAIVCQFLEDIVSGYYLTSPDSFIRDCESVHTLLGMRQNADSIFKSIAEDIRIYLCRSLQRR